MEPEVETKVKSGGGALGPLRQLQAADKGQSQPQQEQSKRSRAQTGVCQRDRATSGDQPKQEGMVGPAHSATSGGPCFKSVLQLGKRKINEPRPVEKMLRSYRENPSAPSTWDQRTREPGNRSKSNLEGPFPIFWPLHSQSFSGGGRGVNPQRTLLMSRTWPPPVWFVPVPKLWDSTLISGAIDPEGHTQTKSHLTCYDARDLHKP